MKMRPLPRPDAPPPVAPAELVAAYGRKRETLVQQDNELRAQQLRAEAANVSPIAPTDAPDVQAIAREILNGFAPRAVPTSAGEALHGVIVARRAIAIALEFLDKETTLARAIWVAETMEATRSDWIEICRRRALALLALRRANADAAAFRSKLQKIAKGAGVALKCDFTGAPYFGAPVVGDRIYLYLKACVEAGILSQGEIDDA